MRFLITGACGFIGKHLCVALLKQNHNVIGIDNFNNDIYPDSFKYVNSTNLSKYSNYIEIRDNILNNDYVLIHNPDVVIHLAAHANVRKSFLNPHIYVQNNILVTSKIVDELLKCENPPLFIYASSSSVYGKNTKIPFSETDTLNSICNMYALTKKTCEDIVSMYCAQSNLKAIGLRFFTVYGPGGRPDMGIYTFLNKIKNGDEVTIYGNGVIKRDFTYVEDIIKGILETLKLKLHNGEHRVYNLGNHSPVDLNTVIELCEKTVGKKANIVYKPLPKGEVPITYADISKANTDLNFIPIWTLEKGIQATYDWMQDLNLSN